MTLMRLEPNPEVVKRARGTAATIMFFGCLSLIIWLAPQAQSKITSERSKSADAAFWKAVAFQGQKAVAVIDADTSTIVDLNPATEQLLGWSRDELSGRQFYQLLPEQQRTAHRQFLKNDDLRRELLSRVCTGDGYVNTAKGNPVKVRVTVSGLKQDRYYFVVTMLPMDALFEFQTASDPPGPEIVSPKEFGPKVDVEPWKQAFEPAP